MSKVVKKSDAKKVVFNQMSIWDEEIQKLVTKKERVSMYIDTTTNEVYEIRKPNRKRAV